MFILEHPSVRELNTADIPVKESLGPFVLQRETTWFLSHVEWNRVDMHEGECVLRESNAEREREKTEKCLVASHFLASFRGSLMTLISWRYKQFCFPVSLTLPGRRFIVLKSAIFM